MQDHGVSTHGRYGTHDDARTDELIRGMGQGTGLEQQEARLALEKKGSAAVGPLIQALLHSRDPVIRWRAAEALGHIGDPRAVDPLIRSMGDPNTAVQWRSIEALADIGEPALGALDVALSDMNVDIRWGANRAMTDIRCKMSMEENERYFAKVNKMNGETAVEVRNDEEHARVDGGKGEGGKGAMCSVCGKEPAVNHGYCDECSGRRGFC